jgi:hypothetical protein
MAWLDRGEHGLNGAGRAGAIVLGMLVLGGILAAIQVPPLQLSGSQQVPAVQTTASATSTIEIMSDLLVAGVIETSGITGTGAHLHVGAQGSNGQAILTLEPQGANRWAVPAGTHLSREQYAQFRAGKMYVDVHSAAHPDGELRLQLVSGA